MSSPLRGCVTITQTVIPDEFRGAGRDLESRDINDFWISASEGVT
ncbi:hypothetical protein D3OALGB2SA_1148 [Olavius algarvensis associated proteobacterium Delta 3]|nr:hypothetical protein D3OALGB2SA_1148 [Olavius algarvensis associated proteobacterium Delta 3]